MIDDLMTIRIRVEMNGIETQEDGTTKPVNDSIEMSLSAGSHDSEGTAEILEFLAEAVSRHGLYGWMKAEQFDYEVASGEIRAETVEEMLARYAASQEVPPGITSFARSRIEEPTDDEIVARLA